MNTYQVFKFQGTVTGEDGNTKDVAMMHAKATNGFSKNRFANALRHMLIGWEMYAKAHQHEYESPIGKDGVCGEVWAELGLCIKELLVGQAGEFDCGSLAANITNMIEKQGFKVDCYRLAGRKEN